MTTAELIPDTQHLVRQSRAGDQVAFASLVEAHQSAVFGTVLRLVYDRELAADVSNRAFYKAYESLATFDDTRPLAPWLLRIAANEALNELRTRRREAARTMTGAEAEIELERLSGDPDPSEILARGESGNAVRDAVNRLPEPQRVVVVLRYFSDLSYADIAELTQQSVNNVGVTLLRARDRLRTDLQRQGVTLDALS